MKNINLKMINRFILGKQHLEEGSATDDIVRTVTDAGARTESWEIQCRHSGKNKGDRLYCSSITQNSWRGHDASQGLLNPQGRWD